MSTTKKFKKEDVEAEVENFDWSKLDALSDEQIEQDVKLDPDAVLLTESELAGADLVIPVARVKNKHVAQ